MIPMRIVRSLATRSVGNLSSTLKVLQKPQ
jgi:hypothetical protein